MSSMGGKRLANACRVTAALRCDPAGRIVVRVVLTIRQGAETGFDVLTPALVLERAAHGFADKRAATSPAGAFVELLYEILIQPDVQSHGRTVVHKDR